MTDDPYATPDDVNSAAEQAKRPLFTFGRVLAVVGTLLVLVLLIIPSHRRAGTVVRRTPCKNNLRNIAVALLNYHDVYESLPPAYTVASDGQPLHSWRTLILPYLDEQRLYDSIDLSKPWDHPVNAAARETELPLFRCPSVDLPASYTTYLAVVGDDCCFRTTEPRPFSEITDGTRNTLMVFEVGSEHAVHWMAPQDADEFMVVNFANDDGLSHTSGTQVALADGSVRFLSRTTEPETLKSLTTVAGDDNPPNDAW
jgi:Protein of unknown function (DUF1559)